MLSTDPISLVRSCETDNKGMRTAVILLHGMTATPDEMADLARFLHDRHFDVFVPCLSGHGSSVAEFKKTPSSAWLADAELALKQTIEKSYQQIFVVGLSFGSLLAMHLAANFPDKVDGLVVLSPAVKFRSAKREMLLGIYSYLPDFLLNCFGVVEKKKRDPSVFAIERRAYTVHSIAAGARLFQVRRKVLAELPQVISPMLVLSDPEDHHLADDAVERLERLAAKARISRKEFPGAQHEMTIGKQCRQVFEETYQFLDGLRCQEK